MQKKYFIETNSSIFNYFILIDFKVKKSILESRPLYV